MSVADSGLEFGLQGPRGLKRSRREHVGGSGTRRSSAEGGNHGAGRSPPTCSVCGIGFGSKEWGPITMMSLGLTNTDFRMPTSKVSAMRWQLPESAQFSTAQMIGVTPRRPYAPRLCSQGDKSVSEGNRKSSPAQQKT